METITRSYGCWPWSALELSRYLGEAPLPIRPPGSPAALLPVHTIFIIIFYFILGSGRLGRRPCATPRASCHFLALVSLYSSSHLILTGLRSHASSCSGVSCGGAPSLCWCGQHLIPALTAGGRCILAAKTADDGSNLRAPWQRHRSFIA
ncbi:hypothetical protein DFH94DRAFT_394196 [Russula ochroleuca]|jgi:hypothetical protein|uniref:Uncharacterized protein n=1 Tax=Russula ochroleuca TaxID=152965 RepID=A0A9P5JUY6_9AGAM|nr:hypothetical protein DFH94DRAFT_394196 [Russula ochroleuca]